MNTQTKISELTHSLILAKLAGKKREIQKIENQLEYYRELLHDEEIMRRHKIIIEPKTVLDTEL